MKRKVPDFKTDEEAEAFLEQDLSDLDFSQFKPMRFEFKPKQKSLNLRISEELLEAVANWRTSELFTSRERLVLDFTEQFCGDSAAISDETLASLAQCFEPGEIVELTLVIGKYLSQGRFMQVLGLDQTCATDLSGSLQQEPAS